MKPITWYRIVMWLLVLATMTAIFMLSAQNGEDSAQLSGKVLDVIEGNVTATSSAADTSSEPQTDSSSQTPSVVDTQRVYFMRILRKFAHVFIYALLGFLLLGTFSLYKGKWYHHAPLAALIGVIYAATDELHQRFVPGRNGAITDVGIDFCGVVAGIALMLLVLLVINTIKRNKASAQ